MAQIDLVEQRLMRAYMYLFLVPADSTGTKSVSLARFGQYEVRLVELTADEGGTWLELFARNTQTAIDGCCFRDLQEAADAAGHLISSARQLHDRACEMN